MRWLRIFFVMAQPPLLDPAGHCQPEFSFTASATARTIDFDFLQHGRPTQRRATRRVAFDESGAYTVIPRASNRETHAKGPLDVVGFFEFSVRLRRVALQLTPRPPRPRFPRRWIDLDPARRNFRPARIDIDPVRNDLPTAWADISTPRNGCSESWTPSTARSIQVTGAWIECGPARMGFEKSLRAAVDGFFRARPTLDRCRTASDRMRSALDPCRSVPETRVSGPKAP